LLTQDGDCPIASLNYTIQNNGVVVAYPTDGSCQLNELKIPGIDSKYEAIQFHIHAASEHSVDGQYYGAELHIVHREIDGDRLAVVGEFLDPGLPEGNPLFTLLLNKWLSAKSVVLEECGREDERRNAQRQLEGEDKLGDDDHFNVYDLLRSEASFYQYKGSLTTPPCSEIVDWNMASTPQMISVKQYTDLLDVIYKAVNPLDCENFAIVNDHGSTSRPTQPLNGRKVKHVCAEMEEEDEDNDEDEDEDEEVREYHHKGMMRKRHHRRKHNSRQ
jgi:carbonic anhydrase